MKTGKKKKGITLIDLAIMLSMIAVLSSIGALNIAKASSDDPTAVLHIEETLHG